MNKNSIKDFIPESEPKYEKMVKISNALRKEGVYMGKTDDFEIYNFGCTIFVYLNKIRISGKLPVTILYHKSKLEKIAEIKLKEI